jgi:hypothetical protein
MLTIEAYNKNFVDYTDKFMNYSPYARHVIDFAGFLENWFKVWISDACNKPIRFAKVTVIAKYLSS